MHAERADKKTIQAFKFFRGMRDRTNPGNGHFPFFPDRRQTPKCVGLPAILLYNLTIWSDLLPANVYGFAAEKNWQVLQWVAWKKTSPTDEFI